ncbi:hypothetical protein [Lentiprolixibacter aurantiacus]|uniref:Uncharacterized protein n=1 Tax=Lentiprolixibacter aurantiacus TaxID=2993939 RepID=A0AAE3MHR2_9FLAO|nr:hypothetical protein [Lentiprolixibacter aurantiacus]MCX2717985.1 hypothetical protein [Lentiprolixibacter aurantiacus]
MRREILTGILGLVSTVLALGAQTGNSPKIINQNVTEPVIFIEEVSPVNLGFDTALYLPEDFNPYAHPENFMDVSFIEEEDKVELDFDVQEYLPKYFNPYKKYFDLNSIEYIEEEEEIEFDFEIRHYLPEGFSAISAS